MNFAIIYLLNDDEYRQSISVEPSESLPLPFCHPTGKRFAMALHEVHHIESGRLTHTWHLEDRFGWMNQVCAWHPNKEIAL